MNSIKNETIKNALYITPSCKRDILDEHGTTKISIKYKLMSGKGS